MRVILTQNVPKLGRSGEVKNVADGYAINFLVPNKLATPTTAAALQGVAQKQAAEQKTAEAHLKALQHLKTKLENKILKINVKVNDKGSLFAQVKAHEIAQKIKERYNVKVAPGMIVVGQPIKQLGEHIIEVKLTSSEKFKINVHVAANNK
jgi:large subunit ribosomal protein L9